MTQEEKQLLLKDLCARLPYGVIINKEVSHSHQIEELIDIGYGQRSDEVYINGYPLKKSRPYLRPMSSMTEEEIEEATDIKRTVLIQNVGKWYKYEIPNSAFIDWLNAHHFDYRELIEKGLALKAPDDMYKTE